MPKGVKDQKGYAVIQSNELVRYFRHDTSWNIQQQKVYYYLASLIKGDDEPETVYQFKLDSMRKTLGMTESGTNYQDIMNILKYLRDHSQWIRNERGKLEVVSILQSVEISDTTGNAEIKFHRLIQPYLFQLRDHYTREEFGVLLTFSCKYTSELYLMLLSYFHEYKKDETQVMFKLNEIKERLACKYDRWIDIKRFVIEKAVEEINSFSYRMRVEYEPIGVKNKITAVIFYLKKPESADEAFSHKMIAAQESWKQKHKRGKPKEETKKRKEAAKKEKERLENEVKELREVYDFAKVLFDIIQKTAEMLANNPSNEVLAEHEKDIEAISKQMASLQARLDKLGVPLSEPIELKGGSLKEQIETISEGMKNLQARFDKLEKRQPGQPGSAG